MRKSCCYDARKSDWNYHWSNSCTMLAFTLHKLFSFIIYLLEDEYEISLGMLICLQRIDNLWSIHAIFTYVYNTFIWFWCTLYDLFRTNPDWRCFQQNYRGVVFVQKMKVLGIARNFFAIFSGGNKQHWSEEPSEGSHLSATSQQGPPTPPRRALMACGAHMAPVDVIPTLKIPIYTETSNS